MQGRVLLIGFLGVLVVAALIGAVALLGGDTDHPAGDPADAGGGPWAEVTLRVEGMT
jgi:hypothetical protein